VARQRVSSGKVLSEREFFNVSRKFPSWATTFCQRIFPSSIKNTLTLEEQTLIPRLYILASKKGL
jgi:hypothetical protein